MARRSLLSQPDIRSLDAATAVDIKLAEAAGHELRSAELPASEAAAAMIRVDLRFAGNALLGVALIGGCHANNSSFGVPAPSSVVRHSSSCFLSRGPLEPLVLASGRTMSIFPQSLSTRGNDLLAVGSHAHVWPRGATQSSASIDSGTVIGFLRRSDGSVEAMRRPVLDGPVSFPRVASAGARGWHGLFATPLPGAKSAFGVVDSAALWYARYDRGRWHDVKRISVVRHAVLDLSLGADLVSARGTLSFAYAFERTPQNGAAKTGVVMLQRRNGRWRSDTLTTWDTPSYVRLAHDGSTGAVLVGIVQGFFERHGFGSSSLFLVRYDTTWGEPRRVGGDGKTSVTVPQLLASRGWIVASWATFVGKGDTTLVHQRVLRESNGVAGDALTVARGSGAIDYEIIPLELPNVLWLLRKSGSRDSVRSVLVDADSAHELPAVELPLDSPQAQAVVSSDGTIQVVISRLARDASEPPATTFVSKLRLQCDGADRVSP